MTAPPSPPPTPQLGAPAKCLAFIFASSSLAALSFNATALLPKTMAFSELSGGELPPYLAAPIRAAAIFLTWHVDLVLTALCLACLALTFWPKAKPALTGAAGSALVLLSLGLFFAAIGSYVVGWLAETEINEEYEMRLLAYRRTLEDFALLEKADNRFERALSHYQNLRNLNPKPIENINALKKPERVSHIAGIVRSIESLREETPPHPTRKRLLATSLAFRPNITAYPSYSDRILPHAVIESGQGFATLDEFYDWLTTRIGTDGWDPVPLYDFKVRR